MSVIPKHNGNRVYENYSQDISSEGWDVIVIGSGMGGMSVAAALSKLGRKVLVLEQHYIPGGFTHMFARKGYKWDVGVHVMGEMREGEVPAKMMKWLTNGKAEMVTLGDPYDGFYFPDDYDFQMAEGNQKFLAHLKSKFPEEEKILDKYWKTVKKVEMAAKAFFLFQTLPRWLEWPLSKIWYGLIFRNWWKVSTEDAINEFGMSEKLKRTLTSHWGYYGSVPKESSFGIHCLTHTHFWNGAFYPKGGAKKFAEYMLANVVDKGGKVAVRANVDEILVKDGKAYGVRMEDGKEFKAPIIISAAGAKTTVNKLVPDNFKHSEWGNSLRSIGDSPSYLCLNIAFKGDIASKGAGSSNMWLYTIDNNDQQLWDITNPDEVPHLLYVSFPSMKDPEHQRGQKETGECVTFVDWDAFIKWDDSTFGNREVAYETLKASIEKRLLDALQKRIPDIMEQVDFCELSTPLTSKHYCRASKGAIYGLNASIDRFSNPHLRTRTPIKNFYLSGVDVATVGVVSGMVSGILTAATIDKRAYLKLL